MYIVHKVFYIRWREIMKRIIKRVLIAILAVIMVLTFAACGKSEEAKAADSLITAIGTVTLDSKAAIDAAEKAVALLTAEDKASLENLAVLDQAKLDYENLVNLQAAQKIDKIITDIGTVTLESADAIAAARAAYESASDTVKSLVTKLPALASAEEALIDAYVANANSLIDAIGTVTFDSEPLIKAAQDYVNSLPADVAAKVDVSRIENALSEYTKLRVHKAIDLINAIGTVTSQSGSAITEAETYFKTLNDGEKAQVTNASVLDTARAQLTDACKSEAQKILSGMIVDEDIVRNMAFYYPRVFPYYTNYWGADVRCFALPYLGIQNNKVWLRLVCDYTADDWVFFKKIIFSVDGKNTTKSFNYFDVTRDNEYGDVWEYVDIDVGNYEIALLESIANSNRTIIRFQGDNYYHDFTVSEADKAAIRQMLNVFQLLKDAGYNG